MPRGLIVQKYGGSSVADVGRIKNVANRVAGYKRRGYQLVVVVSALGDTTDELVELSQKINPNPSEREMDMLMATGEQASAALLAMAIQKLGHRAISFTGAQVGILTDNVHTRARILNISAHRIIEEIKEGKIVIVAGFQGVTAAQDITTLGRGGSDLTAVALAKAVNADLCEIYTDVEGIYTADPRIINNAKKMSRISYDEMLELASLGAQVMQSRSIEVAKKFDVKIHVRSSLSKSEGTIICKEVKSMEGVLIRGVTLTTNEAKITICDVPDKPGIAAKIFKAISKANINVDMIVQNISRTGSTDLSFTVPTGSLNKAMSVASKLSEKIGGGKVSEEQDIARVSIVGIGMKSHPGVAASMFGALAKNKINIEMISTSEISISCIIKQRYGKKAVRALHKKFNLAHAAV